MKSELLNGILKIKPLKAFLFLEKTAFTLAEVLITLGIIGIVASMTIPTIIKEIRTKEIVVGLQKQQSVMFQAFNMAVADNGPPENWGLVSSAGNETQGSLALAKTLKPYLKIIKDCGVGTSTGCVPASYTFYNTKGNVTQVGDGNNVSDKIQMADGSLYMMWALSQDCSLARGNSVPLKNICAVIAVDVNGFKKPNVEGIDAFRFLLTKYGIVPFGTQQEDTWNFSNSCLSTASNSWGCTAWVLSYENLDYTKCSNLMWGVKTKCD